ncbi:hypothetical protein NEMBOFW57_003471 [Staphylotrichum longicolle]|uniref:Uncharacterized protein n=1 Tax=Staphylotrichum longicolle TaxID=669026 RepID=A0AAD4F5I2_9PEZI|nr:hypothetical protein NEMBOFW57_003471 [Staphylotrichum longicolle]
MASISGQSGVSAVKLTKARGKMVKPILKKLSHSEKNSLDLDRGWEEQQVEQLEAGDGTMGQVQAQEAASAPTSSFITAAQVRKLLRAAARGAFVHPFAQTPRTSTPPLSYANSLASFDNGRDCSPTITENEDDDGFDTSTTYPHSHAHSAIAYSQPPPAGISQSNLRRPSLNSQRTSSYTDTPSNPPSLRIITGRSVSGTTAASARITHGSLLAGSHSDLHLSSHNPSASIPDNIDSPTGSLGASSVIASSQQQSSQLSPLRTSLDMAIGFPRLRSRSELDTATRAENVRAARRKFEEREKVKEEKYDREMIRKRERRDREEALRIERGETPSRPAMHRKKTNTGLSTVSEPAGGSSSSKSAKGGPSTRTSPHRGFSAPVGSGGIGLGIGRRRHTTEEPTPAMAEREKPMGFAARRYESVALQTPPAFGVTVDDVRFEQTRQRRRGSSTKRKTQGYWQAFLLWLRTKLLHLGGR